MWFYGFEYDQNKILFKLGSFIKRVKGKLEKQKYRLKKDL